jgi:hypothetical protein
MVSFTGTVYTSLFALINLDFSTIKRAANIFILQLVLEIADVCLRSESLWRQEATGIIAVSESSPLAEANSAASTSLVPLERRVARRGTVLVRERRGTGRISQQDFGEDSLQVQVESLASAYVPNGDLNFVERLDVAGQYWFYATMLTSGFYPTISVWA